MDELRAAATEFGRLHPGSVVGEADTFRHDSWQLLLRNPELAFRAAVFLRVSLRVLSEGSDKYDTRVSIGVGGVESVSKGRISDSRGEAFALSGKGLDGMKKQGLVLAHGEGADAGPWPALGHGVVPLLDCVVGDWSPTESRAVVGALKGWTQEETARQWPPDDSGKRPTRQAVSDSLLRAHWNTVLSVLEWTESTVRQALGVASP